MTQYAFFQGKIVPIQEAKISVMTHAFNYGTGCFEGIRAYWNQEEGQLYVFRLKEHYERLLRSCRILRIGLPYSADDLCGITVELLKREGYREDSYVRPVAYKADEVIGVRLHNLRDEITIFATPFGRYIEREEGAHVCISSWQRVDDNATPARAKITGAYINSAFAKTDAVLSGYDEALVLTATGHISEGSAENFFMVRDGRLVTPPVTSNILEGITRSTIMTLAWEEMGLKTTERNIDRSEIYVCEEAFLCGTGVQIAAITQVEHRPLGTGSIGPVVSRLRDLYFSVVRGKHARYRSWCTPVYEGQ
ncbi:MAG TPA: branched-chain amino acid transaminase [Anaerolineae bacterium]|nr:branched-chain amino acid transaminase [Anaerolineae bacterium]